MAGRRDILILTPWFPNRPDGWPARYISDSATALARLGHRVRVGVLRGYAPPGAGRLVAPEHRGRIEAGLFDGIERIGEFRYPTLPRGLLRRLTNLSLDRAADGMLAGFLAERRPDILVVHTEALAPGVVPRALAAGLPVMAVLHGQNTNSAYLSAGSQADRFRKALSAVDRLVIVGEPMRAYARMLAGRGDHVEVIGNGVDPPARMRIPPDPDTAPVELVAVANLQEGKGIDLLIAALGQLAAGGIGDWRLRIIGDGPMRDALRAQAARAGLDARIRFLGAMANSRVFAQLAEADVFVLPSYREAFGVAYLEAMSTGLLTIGVQGEGPSRFIDPGRTGLLVAPRSVESLVETLRPVLSGPRDGWRRISQAGAAHARTHCTWQTHAARMTGLMDRLIEGCPG